MKLSLEIPTSCLKLLSSYTDSDFALAHMVLQDSAYADFHAMRPANRELILDNSFHELGEALPIEKLLQAADIVRANYVVAPDKLDDPDWTREQFFELAAVKKLGHGLHHFGVAVVMQGRTPAEREKFLEAVWTADMLCLPYRRPRLDWYHEQNDTIRYHWRRIHLLGVNELAELRAFAAIARGAGTAMAWSVDTSKPLKWGLAGKMLHDVPSLRGTAPTKDFLHLQLGDVCHDLPLILRNIGILREAMQG